MDTSEQYIKMADCEEIQSRWNPAMCDNYAFFDDRWVTYNFLGDGEMITPDKLGKVFLPRQDQLQKMVETRDVDELLNKFEWFMHKNFYIRSDFWWKTLSMEQLWLAFVMQTLHSKVWDGSGWIASC